MSAPRVAVVDYGIGNLGSATKALQHCGAEARLCHDDASIDAADAVVLPGVGAFGACMDALRARDLEPVVQRAAASGRPFLGVCVGMQMMFSGSDESPDVAGLAIIPGVVRWLGTSLPRPQMQWNRLQLRQPDDPLFQGMAAVPWMYFVHSLHGVPDDANAVIATCDYGQTVNVAFRVGAVAAVQFHPEKSSTDGLALLANFVKVAAAVRA
jgi:imidazole glycerol-phosphate synthase subunit HisH